jgi:sigma-B regulation protein RsbU (phosphoserine phosphatase)
MVAVQTIVERNQALLSRVPLFATLPPAEIANLARTLEKAGYAAGTVLFREGERGDRFYIVVHGQIAIVKAMGTDDERLIGIRSVGEFVGEMSLLNRDGLRTASVRVLADVQVLELTRADFDALLERHPSLVYELLQVMSTRLRNSHEAAIRDLHEKNQRLARAYADLEAAQARIIEQETLARELRLAREIQESMLPRGVPRPAGFDFGARMVPARMVGGDFYDFFPLDADTLGIVVGDVSGKGMPAALFMAIACNLLRAEATGGAAPEETLRRVNQQLVSRNTKGMFVTVLYGALHLPTRAFTFVRAGHELPLLCDASGSMLALAHGRGHPLGLFPNPLLDLQRLILPPQGTLLLYTDGVTDTANPRQELFGLQRLHAAVCHDSTSAAQDLCDCLVQTLADYQGAAPQADDITLVAVRAPMTV